MPGLVSLIALALWIVAFVALIGLGFYVVMRHPDKADPKRDEKRFTIPALILLVVGLAAFFVGSITGIIWIVQTIAHGLQ